jgi:hypothetical protein
VVLKVQIFKVVGVIGIFASFFGGRSGLMMMMKNKWVCVKFWVWEVKGNERRAKEEDLQDAIKVEVRIRKDVMAGDLGKKSENT